MDGKCLDENNQTIVETMRQYKDEQYVEASETARNLIETSIQISRGAQITSDAVLLAVENEIEVLFNNRTGKPMACIWSPKYGPVATIRKGQLAFTFSPNAVGWIKEVLCKKTENQQTMLLMPFGADAKVA